MQISPAIKRVISKNGDASDIKDIAVKEGMHTLKKSAAQCVLAGTTSMDDMIKVTYEVEE